jgi:hypothetical protein
VSAPTWEDVALPAAIPRDRWDRPLVIPPTGGTPIPYRRATRHAGAPDDTYTLGEWDKRMVAVGLSQRPDLLLQVSSLGSEPAKLIRTGETDWVPNPAYRPWVNSLNKVTEAAREAAKASAKATIGSALHLLAEKMDSDQDVGTVPMEYLPHLAAYAEATAGWEWLAIERFSVQDDLKVGGTPDRVARIPGHDRPVIADLKTGNVDFGQGKMASQLALYAHSVFYTPDGTRTPLPADIDQELGIIIALDATTATCRLLRIDIGLGWAGALLSQQIWAWRAHKQFTEPWKPAQERPPARLWAHQSKLDSDSNLALLAAIGRASSVGELTELWESVRPSAWTEIHTRAAGLRKSQLLA